MTLVTTFEIPRDGSRKTRPFYEKKSFFPNSYTTHKGLSIRPITRVIGNVSDQNSLSMPNSLTYLKITCTVKPRFWNTSWSAANVFQNRGPHFGKKIEKVSWVTIFIMFLC